MGEKYQLSSLKQLEAESIYIFREVAATFRRPVLLYSIGKDSSVLLRLAQKAFFPGKIPFPLLHVDTGFKFREMIEFRDYYIDKIGVQLIVEKNDSLEALSFGPNDAHTDNYIYHKKTKPLLDALERYRFDAAIGGARREEEKSRAKERIFSVRNEHSGWNPKLQRPELWNLYNTQLQNGQSMRVFPLSNWTEADIWAYILQEKIEVVSLYFAEKRKLVKRNNSFYALDNYVIAREGEEVIEAEARYRTLGCSPSTGAVLSCAKTVEEILCEVLEAKQSERSNRAIDKTSDTSMEHKKKQGYF
ncbi:MAG: sulfate adenylyltransferase small subunit [Candidatus Magasanikbacteria bacterium CG10_big_fil_rev_8_21_14_0_10_38_6]|uniref:Sulfate adenylyltransferase subunit 2 n=1 Tax=Candidatus Magasanikbacteria bacterium CG10_big_fil_rev_8_21_14_0_10_38_6 TaxID=1974647 RepID=A0A2M6P187_9BACT|nr:MAG: sulfate adenylyltransferase small subunit [Candidatus Magasanikbacteria bacterium CG10_big_fil_rev_8_21_14_0_10_38_6]